MKWAQNLLDRQRRHFEEGGRLHKWHALYEATDSFFFSTPARTSQSPHVRDPLDVKRYMSLVIVALLPSIAVGLYLYGLRVGAMILVSYAAGGAVEVLFAVVRKEEINEGFLVTGMILPLTLPPALPLWMVAVGSVVGVVVGKELFGGTGRNLFNPALVGRCFLALSYPNAISTRWIIPGSGLTGRLTEFVTTADVHALTMSTPLLEAKQGMYASVSDLVLGTVGGSVGETSAIAILIGGLFLLAVGIINWRTVAGGFGAFAVFGVLLHAVDPAAFGPAGWHLWAGGLMFGLFFMATDPITGPATHSGKWVYGALIGLLTVLIRNLTGYVEGVMFAILLANIAAPLIDDITVRVKLTRTQYATR